MDFFSHLLDQAGLYHGWRFYLPLVVAAGVAAVFHFTTGWTPVTTTIMLIVVLGAVLTGIAWQRLHELDP